MTGRCAALPRTRFGKLRRRSGRRSGVSGKPASASAGQRVCHACVLPTSVGSPGHSPGSRPGALPGCLGPRRSYPPRGPILGFLEDVHKHDPAAADAHQDQHGVTGSTPTESTPRRGSSWTAWCARREAVPLPGTSAFLSRVRALGGEIAIVTNRAASECPDTEAVFQALALPRRQRPGLPGPEPGESASRATRPSCPSAPASSSCRTRCTAAGSATKDSCISNATVEARNRASGAGSRG